MSIAAKIKGGAKSLDNMEELLLEELKDLYDVEHRIIDALPEMADAAQSPQLRSAFEEHKAQSQRQKQRLEECFRHLHKDPDRGTCEGIKGILEEGEILRKAAGEPSIRDAAMVAAAQRVEHYEMASYGAARAYAQRLNHPEVAQLLQQTLDEEGQTDHKLTDLASQDINPSAQA